MNYDQLHTKSISNTELKQTLKDNELLIELGTMVMESICYSLNESIYLMMLTDKNGIVIALNDAYHRSQLERPDVTLGLDFSEKSSGTTSISLTLNLKRDSTAHGFEHFLKIHENNACTTSIIHNGKGDIAGTITITYDISKYNHLLCGMSSLAARLIEEQFTKYRYSRAIKHVVDNSLEAVFVCDSEFKVLGHNENFHNLLNVTDEELQNLDAKSIFREVDFSAYASGGCTSDPKETIIHYKESQYRVNLHISTVHSDGELDIWIFFCQEIRSVVNISRKLTGKYNYYIFDDIITGDPRMLELIKTCRRIANLDVPVLLLGNSGVGKELFAQSIHSASSRSSKPFMAVNCAALPVNLIESELFGYEKGAFTGAQSSKPGKFELADGGTIFLDEIGELPLDLQSKLLRILDNFMLSRIGGNKEILLNVRVIAATNRNLQDEIARMNFREDLFYRLNVLNFHIPSLNQRNGDISLLADHFISDLNRKNNAAPPKYINDNTMVYLASRQWSGNVREFQNAITRAYYLCSSPKITFHYFLVPHEAQPVGSLSKHASVNDQQKTRQQMAVEDALSKCNGKVADAAKFLDIPASSLYWKIKRYNININMFR
jgi:transcriptional regulator with PAS, ATPase and Fis domain